MIKQYLYIIIAIVIFTSCFKEDDPLPPPTEQTTTIEMNQYYQFQTYFDLINNMEVASNDKNNWDLGFENADSSWHITLNTSAFMYAANTEEKDFDAVTDTTGLIWKFDKSDGNPDSTAIGNWLNFEESDTVYTNYVYVLNRGYDHLGNVRRLKKIVFLNVDFESYSIKYADLNGENETEFTILKADSARNVQFSFEEGGQQYSFEPPVLYWDLFFTQYTTLLYTDEGIPYPYLVTGVLINYDIVEASMDSTLNYNDITIVDALAMDYSINKDAVGYDWKELKGDVNSGNVYYEIVEGRNYIIKSRLGLYYKLRFTRFYNEFGDKGYPTFEYLLL